MYFHIIFIILSSVRWEPEPRALSLINNVSDIENQKGNNAFNKFLLTLRTKQANTV